MRSNHPSTETAVVDVRFKDVLKGISEAHKDSLSSIRLTSYEPNRLVYETENAGDGIAVFSEIYYPNGWQVTIDGKPAGLGRADYVLRALYIPAGKHTVRCASTPKSACNGRHCLRSIGTAGNRSRSRCADCTQKSARIGRIYGATGFIHIQYNRVIRLSLYSSTLFLTAL